MIEKQRTGATVLAPDNFKTENLKPKIKSYSTTFQNQKSGKGIPWGQVWYGYFQACWDAARLADNYETRVQYQESSQ